MSQKTIDDKLDKLVELSKTHIWIEKKILSSFIATGTTLVFHVTTQIKDKDYRLLELVEKWTATAEQLQKQIEKEN